MPSIELPLADIPADKLVGFTASGALRDGVVECAGHSWEFNAGDGQCVTVPGHCLTALKANVQGETVRIEWSDNVDDD